MRFNHYILTRVIADGEPKPVFTLSPKFSLSREDPPPVNMIKVVKDWSELLRAVAELEVN